MTQQIEYATLSKSDLHQWDKYVKAHAYQSPYHLSAWGKAVNSSYQHECKYYVAKEQGNIVGVLPVVELRVPLKGKQYCSLPFCDLGGALANSTDIKSGLEHYVQRTSGGNSSVEIRERITQEESVENNEFVGKKVSMLLPLPSSSEDLMAGFKSKLRSQIRKAEKNGLTYQLGTDASLVTSFYDVFSKNMHRLGSPVHSKAWFESIVSEYGDDCMLSIIKKDELVVGAGIILISDNKACIPWASTLVEYNRLSPNMLLYWSLLSHCAESGVEEFDFGRSTYLEGTYKFKAQWGAQPRLLNWRYLGREEQEKENSKGPSKARTLIEQAWKKLPLPIANQIGPKIRRYISL